MADILEERAKHAAETILENESLTDGLDDAAAQVLLDWGLACAKMIAQSTANLNEAEAEETMSDRLRAVRRLMRPMDEWINRQALEPERSAALLAKIIEQAKVVYGEGYTPPTESQQENFLAQYQASEASPQQIITDLRQFLENTATSTTNNSGEKNDQENQQEAQ
jgi:hypothetical protein